MMDVQNSFPEFLLQNSPQMMDVQNSPEFPEFTQNSLASRQEFVQQILSWQPSRDFAVAMYSLYAKNNSKRLLNWTEVSSP